VNDSGDPLEPPRHHQTPTNLPQPGDVPRLGPSREFRDLMLFFAERAPQPDSDVFYRLAMIGRRSALGEVA